MNARTAERKGAAQPRGASGLHGPDLPGWLAHPRLQSNLERGEGGLNRPRFEVVSAAGGQPTSSFHLPAQAAAVAWGPDGGSVTFMDRSDPVWNLYRFKTGGGTPEAVTRFREGRCRRYEWSPDGTRLAIARTIGDATNLWIMRADGSNAAQATRFPDDEMFDLDWTRDGKAVVVNSGKRSSDAVLIRSFR